MENLSVEPLRILAFAALTISVRILTWVSLVGGTALFTYAVIDPTRERTFAAAAYAVLMFLPSIYVEKRRTPQQPPRTRIVQPTEEEGMAHYG